MLDNEVREKFEEWAKVNGHNLTRHPINPEYYYNKEVSMYWCAFLAGYADGMKKSSEYFSGEINKLVGHYQMMAKVELDD